MIDQFTEATLGHETQPGQRLAVIDKINQAIEMLHGLRVSLQTVRRHEEKIGEQDQCRACRHRLHSARRCCEMDRFSEECGCETSMRKGRVVICECGNVKERNARKQYDCRRCKGLVNALKKERVETRRVARKTGGR